MRKEIIASLVLALALGLALARPALAQIYAFHSEIQGIYWNPDLPGRGFAFDVQKGILFGAVYAYDATGEPLFYTLISSKADGNEGLSFSGDVFLTRAAGADTEAVGQFDLQFGRNGGQPALSINLTTPSLNLNDFLLIRFSYAEGDRLGVLSGGQLRTWFGAPNDAANQNGTAWFFANTSQLVDGEPMLDVVDDQGTAGFAFLFETQTTTTYVVAFPVGSNQTLTYDYDLLNDRGGQGIRFVMDDQGIAVGDTSTFSSALVGTDEASTKLTAVPVPAARRREIVAAFGQYLATMGR